VLEGGTAAAAAANEHLFNPAIKETYTKDLPGAQETNQVISRQLIRLHHHLDQLQHV
jgi:hypothetical protein